MCFGTSSGKLNQLVHYGPISAISIILWITINAFNCLIKWFPPDVNNALSIINFVVICLWPMIIFYNYFRAIFLGPGFVPKGWRPANKDDEKYLQYCNICKCFKAPRAHHCRRCARCVMKLDHHCPWINTCTGHFNQANFCWFMFYAILGCVHALFMLSPCIYRALFVPYYPYAQLRNEPIIHFTFIGLISSILSIGFSIGVMIAVGLLLIIQLRNIMRNQTGIENWILRQARDRESFINPYNLGFKENVRQVFNWSDYFNFIGHGLSWPVRALTREEKYEKRPRTVRYEVIKSYTGSFFPLRYGLRACICIPYSSERRISIEKGDYVLVTRWKKYWFYGSRIKPDELINHRRRGWFPRCCVRKMEDSWSHAQLAKSRPDEYEKNYADKITSMLLKKSS